MLFKNIIKESVIYDKEKNNSYNSGFGSYS